MITNRRWRGFYFDGVTAASQPVEVALTWGGIRITFPDGTNRDWRIAEMRQMPGAFSGDERRFEYGSEPVESLVVDEADFAAALRSTFPTMGHAIRDHRRARRRIIAAVATLVAILAAFVVIAGPSAAWLAARVSPEWEAQLADGVEETLAPTSRRCTDSTALASLRTILDRLIAAEPSPYAFRLVIVRDSTVNAFAAPGGLVAVNSGLFDAAASPEEVAAVLAHEIQHVTQRHALQASIRETPIRIAIAVFFGGGGGEKIASFAGSLGALRYRRADEASADRAGLRLLEKADVDVRAMASFMRTLERRQAGVPGVLSYLSTHPVTSDRVAVLESLAAQSRVKARPLLDSATWDRVQRGCSL